MNTGQTLTDVINKMTHIVSIYTPLLIGLVVFFAWMVSDIIWSSGNAEKRKQASQRLTWGIIGIFVFVSIGAIAALLYSTFFGSNSLSLP